jgi:2-methylfumaryl-CoA isomerase
MRLVASSLLAAIGLALPAMSATGTASSGLIAGLSRSVRIFGSFHCGLGDIATAPGPGGGIVLTNLPPLPGLDYAGLKEKRDDTILLRLLGNRDGSAAVDYTVNAASGFPLVTGNSGSGGNPVNHVLPAWDIAAGLYLATALLAAERHRARTGMGQEVVAALSDVMLAAVGHLGYVGDVHINGRARPAIGNDLYGSFGRDFGTADGKRVIIIALTPRQWRALGRATGLADKLAMLGEMMEVDLDTETGRYEARDPIRDGGVAVARVDSGTRKTRKRCSQAATWR